jgi:hypothetical protein
MDVRTGIRNVVIALIGLGLVVLVVALLVKAIFGTGTPQIIPVDVGKYANTSATATLLMDGPTIINQDHRQIKITVSNTTNQIDIIKGYEGQVIDSRTYPSNSSAYASFLQSLKLLGFARGSKATVDYRGFCPTGSRYLYSFNDGQTDLFTFWSTSCGGQGTFRGNPTGVRQLFIAQIPASEYGTLTAGTGVIQ